MAIVAGTLLCCVVLPIFAIFLGKLGLLCQNLHAKFYPEAYERQFNHSSPDDLVMKRLFSKRYEFDEYYNPPIR